MGSGGVHKSLGRFRLMILIRRKTGNVRANRVNSTQSFGVALLAFLASLRAGSASALLSALVIFVLVPGTSAADVLTFQQGDGKGSPSDTDDAEIREASSSFTQAILANIEDVEEYDADKAGET